MSLPIPKKNGSIKIQEIVSENFFNIVFFIDSRLQIYYVTSGLLRFKFDIKKTKCRTTNPARFVNDQTCHLESIPIPDMKSSQEAIGNLNQFNCLNFPLIQFCLNLSRIIM